MVGQFLTRSEIGDLSRELDKTNSLKKRTGLQQHPSRATVCGCPDRRCGGWHVIDTSRLIPTDDEADARLKQHSKSRKRIKRQHSGAVV
jgi:hypothetical protein